MNDWSRDPATATLPLRQWLRIIGAAMNSDTIRPVSVEDGDLRLGGDEELLDAISALACQIANTSKKGTS